LDNMDREERLTYAREGRQATGSPAHAGRESRAITAAGGEDKQEQSRNMLVAPPPGSGEIQYSSLSGD
jgi:pre-mRNA-splicing factor RBM22/SLT11